MTHVTQPASAHRPSPPREARSWCQTRAFITKARPQGAPEAQLDQGSALVFVITHLVDTCHLEEFKERC